MSAPLEFSACRMDPLEIYAQIPTEPTCNGCHQCATRCSGDISVSQDEWVAIHQWARAHLDPGTLDRLLTEDKTMDLGDGVADLFCTFYDMKARGCAIYPVRPLICRLLGFVEWMPCPIGRVDVLLTRGREWVLEYAQTGLRRMSEWLHILPLFSGGHGPARRRALLPAGGVPPLRECCSGEEAIAQHDC